MPSDYNDTGIATGAIANIQNGADAVPIKSWNVNIDPNLTGKSAVECTQAKKNLLVPSIVFDNDTIYTYNSSTGEVTILKSDASAWNSKTELPVKAGTYCINNPQGRVKYRLKSENYGTDHNITSSSGTITLASDDGIKFKLGLGTTYPFTASYQLEVGSTTTAFEKYTAPTVSTVNLGRTIYGGSVDVANGTGTDEYNKITLSSLLTDLNVAQIGTTGVYRIRFNLADAKGAVNSEVFNGLCDYYTPLTANQTYNKNEGVSINTSGQCYIYDSRFNTSTSLNDFKTWIDANPVNLCYELATGTDFTFTPISPTPETALGVNNFWADEGDSELTYYKDGYGFTSVTVHKETPDGEPVEVKRKLHRIIYEGQVDVIRGTGLIYIGESGTEYDPPEQISFTPIEIATDEGENTFYADEGVSVITYRRGVE